MSNVSASSPIRIAVIDDDPIVRDALVPLLGSTQDVEVVASGTNGDQAVQLVCEHLVDVVVMDIQMPVLNGVEATARIRARNPKTQVLLLTTFDDDTLLDGGLTAGASGFLLKTTPAQQIIEAIRTVHAGGKVLSPGPASRVLDRYVRGQSPRNTQYEDLDLSEREQEVLRLLCQASTNREIARAMDIADTTVKTHVSSLMRKMGVTSRLEIVVEAYRRGIQG